MVTLHILLAIAACSLAYEVTDLARVHIPDQDDKPPLTPHSAASDNEDPINENESIDSIFEKKAYFAFKLKNEKLQRRVSLVQEMSKQKQIELWREYDISDTTHDNPLNASFVPAHQLELRLAGFYFDEAEHRDRFNDTFKEIARTLCDYFPRYLTFNRFVVDYGLIRGRLQEMDIDEQPIKKILDKHGFTHRAGSDIASGNFSGFIAVREHLSLKVTSVRDLSAAAKVFLQKPLRASVYVDTLYACIENPTGACEEIASVKLGNCEETRVVHSGRTVIIPTELPRVYVHRGVRADQSSYDKTKVSLAEATARPTEIDLDISIQTADQESSHDKTKVELPQVTARPTEIDLDIFIPTAPAAL